MKKTPKITHVLMPALLLLLGIVGCNESTDDPKVSNNLVSVSSFAPLNACVDNDGEPVDTDGDGTNDSTAFVSVKQNVTFDSRIRGETTASTFNDVIFTSVEINYDSVTPSPPPNRTEAITLTVPAGGTATTEVLTVKAGDVSSGFFPDGTVGSITLIFRGKDASGEPASAVGATAVDVGDVCQ